jgi:hypothetical protein
VEPTTYLFAIIDKTFPCEIGKVSVAGHLFSAMTWPRRAGVSGLFIVVLDQQVRFIIIHGSMSLNLRFQIKTVI